MKKEKYINQTKQTNQDLLDILKDHIYIPARLNAEHVVLRIGISFIVMVLRTVEIKMICGNVVHLEALVRKQNMVAKTHIFKQ